MFPFSWSRPWTTSTAPYPELNKVFPVSVIPACAAHHFSLVTTLLLAEPHECPAELHVLCTAPLGDCDLRSGVSSGFPTLRRVVASVSSTSVFLICLTSFHLAITSFISSFSSNFLAAACRPRFATHNGHLRPIIFLAATLLLATAAPHYCPTAPLGDCEFRSGASSGVPALWHVAGSVLQHQSSMLAQQLAT